MTSPRDEDFESVRDSSMPDNNTTFWGIWVSSGDDGHWHKDADGVYYCFRSPDAAFAVIAELGLAKCSVRAFDGD